MNDDFFMRVWNKQRVSNEMGYFGGLHKQTNKNYEKKEYPNKYLTAAGEATCGNSCC
jgi:hypothetical protein